MREVDAEGFAIRPNKTRLKRELAQIRSLIEDLLELGSKDLEKLNLSDKFMDELAVARKMRPSSGRNRQIKYLAKLLQSSGYEAVAQWLAARDEQHAAENRRFHALEQWRERLLHEGDSALQDYLEQHPAADRQQLRQLIRNARREREQGKPAGAGKKLFRLLRDAQLND